MGAQPAEKKVVGADPAPAQQDDCEYLHVLFRAMAHPECMSKCGWRHVVLLRAASSSMKAWIESGEDAWKMLSQCLANDVGLYCPQELPECSASVSWKGFFFDYLYPARYKWNLESERISDHKIRVAVRFKPGVQREKSLVLPLHQRLKMLKKGEKITAEEARGEAGLSINEIKAQMLEMCGGELDADVLEMLQDAENLEHAASRAECDANNLERKLLDKWDAHLDASSPASGAGGEQQQDAAAGMVGHGAGLGEAGGGGGRGGREGSDKVQEEEEEEGIKRRRSGRAVVLSVERSKVGTRVAHGGAWLWVASCCTEALLARRCCVLVHDIDDLLLHQSFVFVTFSTFNTFSV